MLGVHEGRYKCSGQQAANSLVKTEGDIVIGVRYLASGEQPRQRDRDFNHPQSIARRGTYTLRADWAFEVVMVDTYDYDRNPDLYRDRAQKLRELAADTVDPWTNFRLLALASEFEFLAGHSVNARSFPLVRAPFSRKP